MSKSALFNVLRHGNADQNQQQEAAVWIEHLSNVLRETTSEIEELKAKLNERVKETDIDDSPDTFLEEININARDSAVYGKIQKQYESFLRKLFRR